MHDFTYSVEYDPLFSFFPSLISYLSEDSHARVDIGRIVESDSTIQSRDLFQLTLAQIEISAFQILNETLGVVRFGDDGEAALGCPSEENLSGSYGNPCQ